MNQDNKTGLIITALQQRIGEIVSSYETQIAVLRSEITQLINEKQEHEKSIQEYSDSLNNITN
jgi:restriction endonuclease S subunit